MECSHPVIYAVNGVLTCHICGAVIETGKHTSPEEKPAEAKKTGRKRKAETKAD